MNQNPNDIIEIKYEYDHYVAYVNGKPYCSGDTHQEIIQGLLCDKIIFERG